MGMRFPDPLIQARSPGRGTFVLWLSLMVATALAIGSLHLLPFSRVIDNLNWLLWGLICAWVAMGIYALWRLRGVARDRVVLRDHPRSLVLPGTPAPGLRSALENLGWPSYTGFGLTWEIDESGIRMWTGSPKALEQITTIPWPIVVGVSSSRLKGSSARLTQLNVAVNVDGKQASLSATVLGWGIGGLYSPPRETFDRILVDLNTLSSQPSPSIEPAE